MNQEENRQRLYTEQLNDTIESVKSCKRIEWEAQTIESVKSCKRIEWEAQQRFQAQTLPGPLESVKSCKRIEWEAQQRFQDQTLPGPLESVKPIEIPLSSRITPNEVVNAIESVKPIEIPLPSELKQISSSDSLQLPVVHDDRDDLLHPDIDFRNFLALLMVDNFRVLPITSRLALLAEFKKQRIVGIESPRSVLASPHSASSSPFAIEELHQSGVSTDLKRLEIITTMPRGHQLATLINTPFYTNLAAALQGPKYERLRANFPKKEISADWFRDLPSDQRLALERLYACVPEKRTIRDGQLMSVNYLFKTLFSTEMLEKYEEFIRAAFSRGEGLSAVTYRKTYFSLVSVINSLAGRHSGSIEQRILASVLQARARLLDLTDRWNRETTLHANLSESDKILRAMSNAPPEQILVMLYYLLETQRIWFNLNFGGCLVQSVSDVQRGLGFVQFALLLARPVSRVETLLNLTLSTVHAKIKAPGLLCWTFEDTKVATSYGSLICIFPEWIRPILELYLTQIRPVLLKSWGHGSKTLCFPQGLNRSFERFLNESCGASLNPSVIRQKTCESIGLISEDCEFFKFKSDLQYTAQHKTSNNMVERHYALSNKVQREGKLQHYIHSKFHQPALEMIRHALTNEDSRMEVPSFSSSGDSSSIRNCTASLKAPVTTLPLASSSASSSSSSSLSSLSPSLALLSPSRRRLPSVRNDYEAASLLDELRDNDSSRLGKVKSSPISLPRVVKQKRRSYVSSEEEIFDDLIPQSSQRSTSFSRKDRDHQRAKCRTPIVKPTRQSYSDDDLDDILISLPRVVKQTRQFYVSSEEEIFDDLIPQSSQRTTSVSRKDRNHQRAKCITPIVVSDVDDETPSRILTGVRTELKSTLVVGSEDVEIEARVGDGDAEDDVENISCDTLPAQFEDELKRQTVIAFRQNYLFGHDELIGIIASTTARINAAIISSIEADELQRLSIKRIRAFVKNWLNTLPQKRLVKELIDKKLPPTVASVKRVASRDNIDRMLKKHHAFRARASEATIQRIQKEVEQRWVEYIEHVRLDEAQGPTPDTEGDFAGLNRWKRNGHFPCLRFEEISEQPGDVELAIQRDYTKHISRIKKRQRRASDVVEPSNNNSRKRKDKEDDETIR